MYFAIAHYDYAVAIVAVAGYIASYIHLQSL